MSTWILLVAIWGSGTAPATFNVPGFPSSDACSSAGETMAKNLRPSGGYAGSKWVCVEQHKPR